jgi:hypothetical protein
MIRKSFFSVVSAVCLVFVCVTSSLSQGTTSRVTGIVTDNSGAAVSGATVSLTREGTGVTMTTQTSEIGGYVFDLIQIGSYTVSVEKPGFKKFVSAGNTVNINLPTVVNVELQVGDVSAVVNVQSAAEQVQTGTSGNIGSTIEQKTVESLPIVGLRGRSPLELLNFQPGVVFGGNTGGGVNVHGSRDRSFNFTLDGIDINESTAGGSNFTPLRTNPDSIQEFQIVTSNFTAELGRSSGAQVTLVTRSGGNSFKGNVFDYYQTPEFNAKSYPTTIAGLAKDQFVQHIFGGTFSGPLPNFGFGEGSGFKLLKDKAFFFVNLQLLRAYDTALVTRTVYTPSARAGLFRYVVGRANAPAGSATAAVDAGGNPLLPACIGAPPTNQPCISSYNIATSAPITIDPTLSAIINATPAPNNYTVGDGLNTAGFNFASPQHERQYDFTTKIDYNFSPTSLLYVRYSQGEQNSFGDSANGGRPVFPNSPNLVDTGRNPKNLAINWRWSPNAKLTNEVVAGYSDFGFRFATPEPNPAFPFTFLGGISTPNTNFSYNARSYRTLQFVDNITFDLSPHTIKAGLNFRFGRHFDDRSSVAGSSIEPIVSFGNPSGFTGFNLPASGANSINGTDLTTLQNTIANLLGRVNSISQAFVSSVSGGGFEPSGSRWNYRHKYKEYDFYIQDNWKARRNLTFDIGVRWEMKTSPTSSGLPVLRPDQPVKLGATPTNTIKWVEGELFDSDYFIILPSIGFAWDPFKDGKTAIRANYRMGADKFATFLFGSSIFQSSPGNNTAATNSTFGQGGGLYRNLAGPLATLFPTTTPTVLRQPPSFGTGSGAALDPDLKFPEIHSWSYSVQRELWGGNLLEVNYIGKRGVNLLSGYNANQVDILASVPGTGGNFLQEFNAMRASTAYNSPLINLLMSGSAANNNGTARFRTLFGTAGFTNGNVAAAALLVSQRTCQAADVTATICTNANLNRRLLDVNGFTFLLQPFPQFTGGFNVFDSHDYSIYHGMEVIFKRRIKSGLGYQFAYTLSKSMDTRSFDPTFTTVSTANAQSASSTPFNIRNRRLNYAWSDFDRRHVFQGTYVYELPFGNGKWIDAKNSALNYLIGGWQLAGTTIWMSGRPFTAYSGFNTFSNVVQSTANCNGCDRNLGSLVVENGRNFWFDAAARGLFVPTAPGDLGNTGRNFFISPRYFQTDISVSRKFRFTEKLNLDFRMDARNLTNNPSFDLPTATVTSAIFGRINDGVVNNARRMQMSLKLNF